MLRRGAETVASAGPAIRPYANQFTSPFEQTEDLTPEHVAR